MFHPPPVHWPNDAFLENHCCCDPESVRPSILESAIKPPLDHPPSDKFKSPFMWMRRNAVPCETAQILTLSSFVGVTERFSALRQKLQVALPRIQSAFERTAPVMATSSGDCPNPMTCV